MTKKRIGLLVVATCLLGFASVQVFSELDSIKAVLGIRNAPPKRVVLSKEEREANRKANEAKRLEREAKENRELEAELAAQQEKYATRIQTLLKPAVRWKRIPSFTAELLFNRGGEPLFWARSEHYGNDGGDVAVKGSIRDLLDNDTHLLISDGKPLLVDSKKRIWFGRGNAPLPATQPGAKNLRFRSQQLVKYQDGAFTAERDIVLRKLSDDPTTQGMFAAGASFDHGFEDSQGNLYFIGGLFGWAGILDRLATDGTWTRTDVRGNQSQILAYPQFTDLHDGRIVLSVEGRSQRAAPFEIYLCDNGKWISGDLRFRRDSKGHLSDVTITSDAKVVFVDGEQVVMYDLDGYSPDRLAARLLKITADLAVLDPAIQSRVMQELGRFPRAAITQIRPLIESAATVDTRKRLQSAIDQIENSDLGRDPLDGRYEPENPAMVGRTFEGGVRLLADDVYDRELGRKLGPSLLTYHAQTGWIATPLHLNLQQQQDIRPLLFRSGHGTEDAKGRIWFADTSWIDADGNWHAGDYPDVFDTAPYIDAAGRLYYNGSYVDGGFIYGRGTYVFQPDVAATQTQRDAFRKTIPGTDEWYAATQAATEGASQPATK